MHSSWKRSQAKPHCPKFDFNGGAERISIEITRRRRSKSEFLLEAIRTSRDSKQQIHEGGYDRECCVLHAGTYRAGSSRDDAQARLRRDCCSRKHGEPEPIGVITDRDITWRVVATGKSPGKTSVRDAM